MKDKIYLDVPRRGGNSVRVSLNVFRGNHLIDLRKYYTTDAGAVMPTRQGASLPIADLPRLRAALEEVERDAIAAGLLAECDYEACGLSVPPLELVS